MQLDTSVFKYSSFTAWSKTLNVTGGAAHGTAERNQEPAKQ